MLNIKNVNNKVKELVPKKQKQRLAVVKTVEYFLSHWY